MIKPKELDALVKWAGSDLQEHYVAVLCKHGGTFCSEVVRLYGLDEIIDRNEVYETKKYGAVTVRYG